MSCSACEDAQEIQMKEDKYNNVFSYPRIHTYVRVGNGNVLIAGCEEHLAELIQRLKEAPAA